jgi:murein DD-endopeptidase MepM/ murein hydrolase activator NlpD
MQGGKQMKQKRAICYSLVVVLLFSLLSLAVSFADNDAKDKLNELTNEINKLEKQLKAGKSEEKNLASQISNLDKLIKAAEGEIRDLQGEISYASKQISNVKKELDLMQADIDRQNEEMSDRIRAMYKNGDVGMIEILLGSESIIDFMTNMDMAQKIFDNDVEVLEKLEEQHLILEGHRTQLENLQQQLLLKKQQEASKQSQLQVSRGSVAKLKAEVAVSNKTLESQVDALNAEANALTAEILRLQGSGAYIGGDFAWPAPASTKVTSPFGYRIHPILKVKKLHTGIDIGIGSGNRIVAANAGTVIKAAWNNSYGYMVMIDHGGGIVTLYAHNSKLQVSTGDIVTRGQTVATSGSTGMSTGPHLHFEVRVNGEYKNPMSYL